MEIKKRIAKLTKRQEIHYQEQKFILFAGSGVAAYAVMEALNRAERI